MVLHYGIKPAKEEIRRLNVEITRLLMFLVDEHVDYYRAIAANFITNPPLAMELQKRWHHASRVSAAICRHLALTSRLVNFSGSVFPGQCKDKDPERGDGVPPPQWLTSELGVTLMSVEYEDAAKPDPQPIPDNKDIEGVVIRDLDVKDNRLVQLMDHLSTFEDS
jgi:hypothetical protein